MPERTDGVVAEAEAGAGYEARRPPLEDRPEGGLPPLRERWRMPWVQGDMPEGEAKATILARDARFRRSLAVADMLSATLAVCAAIVLAGQDALDPSVLVAVPVVVLVSKVIGLYDSDQYVLRKATLDEAPRLFHVATLFTLLIWLSEGLFVQGQLGRDQVVGLWAMLFVSMVVARALTRRLALRSTPPERCLLLGDPRSADRVRCTLARSRLVKAELVAEIPLAIGRRKGETPPDAGVGEPLTEVLPKYEIERVIIAPARADYDEILDAVRIVKALGVKVSVLPRLFEVVGSSAKFDDVDGMTLLGVPNYGLTKSSLLLKRTMDVVVSATALFALAPLLIATALAIKLTSRGPVFFRQTRIGKFGEEFQMVKFRSMVDGADEQKPLLDGLNEAEGLFKIADDPRLTTVGRFIRKLSLDEIPQLFNVLQGHMSLVGPRPLVPDEDRNAEGWQRRRLHVPPGMTGVWQILGSARIPFQEMVQLDYLYGANWSLWLDFKILLRTVPYVLSGRGL